jgi:hypothetical protein
VSEYGARLPWLTRHLLFIKIKEEKTHDPHRFLSSLTNISNVYELAQRRLLVGPLSHRFSHSGPSPPIIQKQCRNLRLRHVEFFMKALCLAGAERSNGVALWHLGHLRQFDLSKLLLLAGDVLLQGKEQALGVLRSHDHSTEDLRRSDGEHVREVDDKLAGGVVDHRQVAILAGSHLGFQLYLYLLFVVFCHNSISFYSFIIKRFVVLVGCKGM